MHRAVAEEPVPAAGVQAPVMVPVAGVVLVPGPEPLLAPGAGLSELVSVGTPLLRVGQAHGAVYLVVDPGPAKLFWVRGALAHHQRVRRAVGDRVNGRGTAPDGPAHVGGGPSSREVAPIDKHPLEVCIPRVPLMRIGSVN